MKNALCFASGVLIGLGAGLGQTDGRWGWLVGFGILVLAAASGLHIFDRMLKADEKNSARGR